MNVEAAIKAGFPAASASDIDHIVWGRTQYPFARLGLRDFYKAASRYKRACGNGLRLCDMCDRLAMPGDWVCAGCDAALKTPSEAGWLPTEIKMLKRTSILRKADPTARASVPVFKPRACKVKSCQTEFTPRRSFEVWCSPACGLEIAQEKNRKAAAKAALADRRETKAKLEKLKTRSDYMKEAQREFNKYIRTRDKDKPCICCGVGLARDAVGGAFDAGHYRSVGSAPHLRFDDRNCHAQTKQCNRYGAGRAVDYRRGLIARLGIDAVEALEGDQTPKHYTIEDLKAIKALYRNKTKELCK